MSSKDNSFEIDGVRYRPIINYNTFAIFKAVPNQVEVSVASFQLGEMLLCCAVKMATTFNCPDPTTDKIPATAYEELIKSYNALLGRPGYSSAATAYFVQYKDAKYITGQQFYDAMLKEGWKQVAKFKNTVHSGNTIHQLNYISKGNEL